MTVFLDRFEVGDKVTWRDEEHATMIGGREKHGNGPFTIHITKEVPTGDSDPMRFYDGEQSTISSVGHSQWVELEELAKPHNFSGAFFKKIEP